MSFMEWRMGSGTKEAKVEDVEAPVQESMLWICEKCGFKLAGKNDENPSRSLQKLVKKRLSEEGRKRQVRAMVTSCMNICPKGKISACIVHFGNARPSTRFYEFELGKNSEAMAEGLLSKLNETRNDQPSNP